MFSRIKKLLNSYSSLCGIKMKKINWTLIFLVILIFSFTQIAYSKDKISFSPEKFTISLESREFIPPQQTKAEINFQLTNLYNKHAIIQFEDIPSNQEKESLKKSGITLLRYLPNYAWLVKISQKNIENTFKIRHISGIKTSDKIQPSIIKKGVVPISILDKNNIKIAVIFYDDIDSEQINSLILKYGKGKNLHSQTWEITLNQLYLYDLANEDIIQYIGNTEPEKTENVDDIREIINANEVQEPPYDLHAEGYVVGMWESGTTYTHPDYASRILAEPDGDLDSSHATRVAGVMLGDGARSEICGGSPYQWRGIATQAQVVSYNWTDEINEHNQAINTYNIDVSQNSWGFGLCDIDWCDWLGDYTYATPDYDWIVRGAYGDKITIVGSAGNEGDCTTCEPYLPNFPYGTVAGPIATAKNILSVSGTLADNDELWDHSSRGPTDDGRIKPDISTPACKSYTGITMTWIDDCYIMGGCGTSFAAPSASGSALLIYEDYNNFYSQDPLPSTIRAILYQTAEDLGNTGPDYEFGYGRIDIQRAIDLIREDNGENQKIIEDGLSHSQVDNYYLAVQEGEPELKVTIVWDDKEATSGAGIKLINNLDLELISPSQTIYYPWVLDWNNPSNPATTGIDSRNNMEQVVINSPETGLWTIRVTGTIIPHAPQQYSLVKNIIGENNAPEIEPIGDRETNENEILIIDVNATDLDEDILTYYTNAGDVLPSSFSFNENTGLFEYTPTYEDSGLYYITFNVTDGFLWDEETITIRVNNVNRAPEIEPIEDITINELDLLIITVNASDPDDDFLEYYINDSRFEQDEKTFFWLTEIGDVGEYVFTVTASDGEHNVSTDVNVFILEQLGYDYIPGDINNDGTVIGGDVSYLVNYFIGMGNPPPFVIETPEGNFYPAADVNGDCRVIGGDVSYLVAYFIGTGSAPTYCPDYPPISRS